MSDRNTKFTFVGQHNEADLQLLCATQMTLRKRQGQEYLPHSENDNSESFSSTAGRDDGLSTDALPFGYQRSPRKFLFVEESSARKVKAHAMLDVVRRRRLSDRHRGKSSLVGSTRIQPMEHENLPPPTGANAYRSPSIVSSTSSGTASSHEDGSIATPPSEYSLPSSDHFEEADENIETGISNYEYQRESNKDIECPPVLVAGQPGPLSLLSASKMNPFDTFPFKLSKLEEDLMSHYVSMPFSSMPSKTQPQGLFINTRNTKPRDSLFKMAIQKPLAMQASILFHAAGHRAALLGTTREFMIMKGKVLHRLKEAVYKSESHSCDENILAVISAGVIEDRYGDKEAGWNHIHGAYQMLRNRGGPACIADDPHLPRMACLVLYTMSGYKNAASETPFLRPSGLPDLSVQTAEFFSTIENWEHLSFIRKASAKTVKSHSIFLPNAPILQILSSATQNRVHKVTRLAALFLINAAFWDTRSSAPLTSQFLANLAAHFHARRESYSANDSLMLIWLLTEPQYGAESKVHERPWRVGQMLQIAKRLSPRSWDRLAEILLGYLVVEDEGGEKGVEDSIFSWEERFEKEILGAPESAMIAPAFAAG